MFTQEGFARGTWAAEMKRGLPANLIPGWKATIRLWRKTWVQWLQYEPTDWPSGPKFFLAKPAVLALDEHALCVGLYVERGYEAATAPPGALEQGFVMDPSWHWHGLIAVWQTANGRQQFHSHLHGVSNPVVVIEHSRDDDYSVMKPIKLTNPEAYSRWWSESTACRAVAL